MSAPVIKRQYGRARPRTTTTSSPSVFSMSQEVERSTPPTSPAASASMSKGPGAVLSNKPGALNVPSSAALPQAKKGDLRSFFGPASKRALPSSSSPSQHDQEGDSRPSKRARSAAPMQPEPAAKEKKMEQLYLDPSRSLFSSTAHCATCGMSYARTPSDVALHDAHHRRVTGGVDWGSTCDTGKGVTVVKEGVDVGKDRGGRVIVLDLSMVQGMAKKKAREVMETMDRELGATELSEEQLSASKLFVLVSGRRKVVCAAVVQRIEEAFEVLENGQGVRFGEGEGAVFVSPTPLPTLLGIHRIYTLPLHRRQGLSSLLLDCVAQRAIYGYTVKKEKRGMEVAFSQPTGSGAALAKRWTGASNGTGGWRVFVD